MVMLIPFVYHIMQMPQMHCVSRYILNRHIITADLNVS